MNKLLYIVLIALLIVLLAACGYADNSLSEDAVICTEHYPVITLSTTEESKIIDTSPITDKEIVMLAQTMYQEAQILCWNGTKYGVSYMARQAAVGWCALNRYDAGNFGDTLSEILSKPHQFAYRPDAPVTDELLWLAKDIVSRWWDEKQGVKDSGRTLPSDYLFFEGDGKENYFRKEYENNGEIWDWSLPDPYVEVQL